MSPKMAALPPRPQGAGIFKMTGINHERTGRNQKHLEQGPGGSQ